MTAPWEHNMGIGVAAQFARMYAETFGRAQLLFVTSPGSADLATWGAGAALDSDAVTVIDVSTLATEEVRLVTQGVEATANVDRQLKSLCKALQNVKLLCLHGIDLAYDADATMTLSWLLWCAQNVPLTMVSTEQPGRYVHQKQLAGCQIVSECVLNTALSHSARKHAVDLMNRLLAQGV